METEKELNKKIMELTVLIQEKHPELAQHLSEMPLTIPSEEDPQITIKKLREYYNSLRLLLKKQD